MIVRVAPIPSEAQPLRIWAGEPVAPIPAHWAAIALVPTRPRAYILYLLGHAGEVLETLQYETMRIALDQAHAITGIADGDWRRCNVETPDGERIPPEILTNVAAG